MPGEEGRPEEKKGDTSTGDGGTLLLGDQHLQADKEEIKGEQQGGEENEEKMAGETCTGETKQETKKEEEEGVPAYQMQAQFSCKGKDGWHQVRVLRAREKEDKEQPRRASMITNVDHSI